MSIQFFTALLCILSCSQGHVFLFPVRTLSAFPCYILLCDTDYIFHLRVLNIPGLADRITVLYRRLPDVALNITVIDKSYMPCSGD